GDRRRRRGARAAVPSFGVGDQARHGFGPGVAAVNLERGHRLVARWTGIVRAIAAGHRRYCSDLVGELTVGAEGEPASVREAGEVDARRIGTHTPHDLANERADVRDV